MKIVCGWCRHATPDGPCVSCGRPAALPWTQRGQAPPTVDPPSPGRPALSESEVRHRYAEAVASLKAENRPATVEAIAERVDRSPRTVRDWRERFGLG